VILVFRDFEALPGPVEQFWFQMFTFHKISHNFCPATPPPSAITSDLGVLRRSRSWFKVTNLVPIQSMYATFY